MAIDPNQPLAPQDYSTLAAEKARRDMAMALMKGSTAEPQRPLTSPWQIGGNAAQMGLGASQFNKANEGGRASNLFDASTFKNNLFGAETPPVPGVGGHSPFQASGPMPTQAQPGVGNGLAFQPPPPGGMGGPPPGGPPPMGGPPPGGMPGMGGPPPMPPGGGVPFLGAGGFPPQAQWPNPQG